MRVHSLRSHLWLIAICSFLLPLFPARAGTFKNPLIIPTSSDVLGLTTADVNHDGKLDLIYIDGQGYGNYALHILLGNGNGTFSHGQDLSLPAGVCCIVTVADVTGDGNPDIIMQGSQQPNPNQQPIVVVAVMLGKGDGTFQAPFLSTFQPSNISGDPNFNGLIGVGDINGDGKTDLVLNDGANGEIYLLLGDNSGRFTLNSSILTYMRNSVYLLDLNGDKHLDIVATDLLGADFMVFLGNGNGTFQTGVRYTGQPSTGAFILVDMDGDGHPDMLTEYYPAQLGIFKGNPDGTFTPLSPLASATFPSPLVGVSDFNSGGVPDLIFTTPTGIGIELGTGNLTYSSMKMTVSGRPSTPFGIPPSPVTGDFDMDGHMDLAMPVEGGIAILLGKGDGTFASADFYDMGQQVGAVAVADFNGDKLPDIAVSLPAPFPRLLLGNGQGTFALGPDPNPSYGSQSPDTNMEAADFNGDGKMDLDMGTQMPNGSSSGTQSVAFGLGNGTFTNRTVIQNGSPVVADLNNDGRSDMISLSGATVTALLGQVNESFNQITTALRVPAFLFGVGDVNKDGKLDLVLNYSDHLEIWLGNGDGTFSYFGSVDNHGLGFDPIIGVADVDGDGNADIILGPISNPASNFYPLTIFYGNGDGTFQAPVSLPITHRYTQVVLADVNRDNRPDLVMTDGFGIAVMMNLGNRKFDSETYYVAGGVVSWLSVADVNRDGFPDIVVANPGGTTVTVLLNQPNGTSLEGAATNGNLTIAPEPSISGQPFTISLTVSGATAGATLPTGSVSFNIDGAFVATVPLANGTASYTVGSTLIPIQHAIVAMYEGDSVYAPKNFAALHLVSPPTYTTYTVLTVSPTTVLASQTVRLVATVTSTPPVPSGVITFLDGTHTLGAATVDANGKAYHDTGLLAVGTHLLSAKYDGFTQVGFTGTNATYTSAIFSPSTSGTVTVTVTSDATSTTLSSSAASPTAGTVVTFTAKVGSPAGVPFGGATFYDGSSILGTTGLKSDGSASFSTASLNAGIHNMTAAFNPNGPFAGSTSPVIAISVSAAPATAVPTLVSLAPATNRTDGSSTLVASVGSLQGSPGGRVTFLDNGVILGSAETDQSGSANLRVGMLASGIHRLSASFGGTLAFAPSVSPELHDEWPVSGPGFSVSLGARGLRVTPAGSDALQISIEPLAGFGQEVQLSCAAGLPEGYACSFSPDTVNGGGVSTLTIRPSAKTAAKSPGKIPFYAISIGLFSVALRCGWGGRSRGVALLLVCSTLALLSGCGTNSRSSGQTQMVVLTLRAASGTGPAAIVHSAQVSVVMRGLK